MGWFCFSFIFKSFIKLLLIPKYTEKSESKWERGATYPLCHPDKISLGATPRSTSVLLDFHKKKCVRADSCRTASSEGFWVWPSVLSTLAGAQVFNSLNMSRITRILNCHWDHHATQKTAMGTVATATGETARDRHVAMKAESCQLWDTGGSGDFGGGQKSFVIITLV